MFAGGRAGAAVRVAELSSARQEPSRALLAVRTVRERVEEREERALGEASRQVQQARDSAQRLREEINALQDTESRSLGELSSGAEMRWRRAELEGLRMQQIEALAEADQLERRRMEQMERYRAAHAEGEAIRSLQRQRLAARLAALQMHESKMRDEMFLRRRTWLQQGLEQEMAAR